MRKKVFFVVALTFLMLVPKAFHAKSEMKQYIDGLITEIEDGTFLVSHRLNQSNFPRFLRANAPFLLNPIDLHEHEFDNVIDKLCYLFYQSTNRNQKYTICLLACYLDEKNRNHNANNLTG